MGRRAVNWEELPLLLTVTELRGVLGLTRGEAYVLGHTLGVKVRRRLLVPKARLQVWADQQAAEGGAKR